MPLKLNSQRVPGKNFKDLLGRPLYRWSLDTVRQLRDEGVFDEVAVYGGPGIMEHLPPDVAFYTERDVVVAQDGNALFRKMIQRLPNDVAWCCIFNATSPFTRKTSFEKAMRAVVSGEYDSAASMQVIYGRLWDTYRSATNHDPRTCPRTQTQDPIYLESDAFWILQPSLMLEHGRRIGFRPWFQEVTDVELVDIDTAADWRLAERIGATLCQKP